MKNTFFNISVSIVTFLISYLIAHFTKSPVVKGAVIIAFIIQWVLFLPAYFFKLKSFMTLLAVSLI
jgi:hypothetical protein